MATDDFVGAASALTVHNANWNVLLNYDPISNFRIDGSGNCFDNGSFAGAGAYYNDGTTGPADLSQVTIPIGAFVTLASGEFIGVVCCGDGATSQGFRAYVATANLTGQVVNSIRTDSAGTFLSTVTLSPTIDTSTTALVMSLQRTSTTNIRLIVNGTTYNVNSTGHDITTGFPGMALVRNSATPTTAKYDQWTNGSVPSSPSLYVQSAQASPTASSSTLTLTGVLANHSLLVGVRLSNNSDVLSSVASSINGAFAPVTNTNNTAASMRLYVLKLENVSAGSHTITINFTGSQTYRWFAAEYSAAFVDAIAAAPLLFTTSTTPASPSVTSTVVNDTIVTIIATDLSTAGISPGGTQTEREEVSLALQLQDQGVTTAGAYTGSWVLGTTSPGISMALAMKAGSSLPAPLPSWSKQTFVTTNYIQF